MATKKRKYEVHIKFNGSGFFGEDGWSVRFVNAKSKIEAKKKAVVAVFKPMSLALSKKNLRKEIRAAKITLVSPK